MKRHLMRSRRRTKRIFRAGAALMLAVGLLGVGYYRIVAAQKNAPAELHVEVEILPGEMAKVIDVTTRALVPIVIYGNASVAAESIRPASVAVAGAPPTKQANGQLRAELRDVNRDGRNDLLVTVAAQSLRVGDGDNRINVTAATSDGRRVSGTSQVRILHARQFATGVPEPKSVVFSNTAPITINDSASPPTAATPYPSNLAVSGVTGNIVGMTVTLANLSHGFPDDIDVLLVGPTGASALLMSDAGGSTAASGITLTFDDNAAASLADDGPLVTGTFKPTNFGTGDTFPAPATVPTGNTLLGIFNGTNPNGDWHLYVVDDNQTDAGAIAGGWSLNLLTAPQICNPANLIINDSDTPPTAGSPYPSQIAISGLSGTVVKVTVDLRSLSHTFSDDIDMVLVGPTGASAVIMSDAGGSWPISNLNLTFDDNAAAPLSDTAQLTSGTYQPVNYGPGIDAWPGVAPPPSGNSALSVFNGTDPNGIWKLYVLDDEAGDSGNLGAGWCLNIATTGPTLARLSSQSAAVSENGRVEVEWNASYEIDNLGFNVYRESGGQRLRVNREMIAGSAVLAGPGVKLATGRTYRCFDQLPAGARLARYWIEAIGLDGSSDWHGPVTPVYTHSLTADTASPSLDELNESRNQGDQRGNVGNTTFAITPRVEPGTATAIKLYIKQTGVYRVSRAELLAAGLNPNVDPRTLQLFEGGREQPLTVPSEQAGRFDLIDGIEFYATAPDSPYTASRVYWLVAGSQAGQRIKQVKAKGATTGAASFQATALLQERTVYFSPVLNGERENFFGAIVVGNGVTRSLRLTSVVQGQPATLEVTMQGLTLVPHRISVRLNGEAVGSLAYEGLSPAALRVSLTAAKLREGDNMVQLIAEGGSLDVNFMDAIRLRYGRGYQAEGDALDCTAQGAQQVTISGFSNPAIRVMDVTEAEKGGVQEVIGAVRRDQSGYSMVLNVPGEGTRHLLAFTGARIERPAAIAADIPSSWRQPANAADLLIITRRDLMAAFAPLKALREQQGYTVAVIDIEDLYDEFSYGNKTPQAIKDFLSYAAGNWKTAPRYVLLGGDASYDPNNYLGLGDVDLVPTKLIDTEMMETASDDWFADFNGDGLAEMAIGRLPVRSASEAAALIAKIVAYDSAAPADTLLLVADSNDDFDFEQATAQLRAFIPPGVQVEEIARGQLGDAATRQKLLAAMNEGRKIVNYLGHGNIDEWHGRVLTNADPRELTNSERLMFFVSMTCLNGYFHDPATDSIGEALVKAPRGGAVAAWASSGMNGPAGQAAVNQALYRALFGSGATLGEATLKARAATTNRDIRRTWILLGDPTTRLR
jgi:subtilisin-like proprotein convertase family protein